MEEFIPLPRCRVPIWKNFEPSGLEVGSQSDPTAYWRDTIQPIRKKNLEVASPESPSLTKRHLWGDQSVNSSLSPLPNRPKTEMPRVVHGHVTQILASRKHTRSSATSRSDRNKTPCLLRRGFWRPSEPKLGCSKFRAFSVLVRNPFDITRETTIWHRDEGLMGFEANPC